MASVVKRALGNYIQLWTATIPYTDLIDAATTQAVACFTLPANATLLGGAEVDVVTLFADAGSISAVTVQVGSSGDPDGLFTATGAFTGDTLGRLVGIYPALVGDGLAVEALFTATGANFGDAATTDLDAGQVVVRQMFFVAPD